MKLLTATVAALFIATVLPCTADDNGPVIKVADNGSIVRTVDCSDGHVLSGSFTIAQTDKEFIRKGYNEFSFLSDGKLYSGKSNWRDIKSSTGSLPIMLGDPRKLSKEERAEFKAWSSWVKSLENRHGIMSFRQDLPGFGMPAVGGWDGFCRINTDTRSGGLIGVFREGAAETSRTITVRDLNPDAVYSVRRGPDGTEVASMTGRELETKGFRVTLAEEFSGELFEVVNKDDLAYIWNDVGNSPYSLSRQ